MGGFQAPVAVTTRYCSGMAMVAVFAALRQMKNARAMNETDGCLAG